MTDSMRAKIEQVIRTYGSKDAPVSPADIRAELGLTGRDKFSHTLNRMMKTIKGLRRVQKQNNGSPAHYCYWVEEEESKDRGLAVQTQILKAMQCSKIAMSCKEVAMCSGLTERQVIGSCSKLAEKRLIKRSLCGDQIFLRFPKVTVPSSHFDCGFEMLRHRAPKKPTSKPISKDVLEKQAQAKQAMVEVHTRHREHTDELYEKEKLKAVTITVVTDSEVITVSVREARSIFNQLKEIFQ